MSEIPSGAKQTPPGDKFEISTMDTPKMYNTFNRSAASNMFTSPKGSNHEQYQFMKSGLSVIGSQAQTEMMKAVNK